jgi:hypothetical protein
MNGQRGRGFRGYSWASGLDMLTLLSHTFWLSFKEWSRLYELSRLRDKSRLMNEKSGVGEPWSEGKAREERTQTHAQGRSPQSPRFAIEVDMGARLSKIRHVY